MRDDFECGTCGKAFPAGWRARDSHCRATGHQAPRFECDTCARWFRSEAARQQHMGDTNHFQFECNICSLTWPTEEQRREHEQDEHLHCADCNRTFQSPNTLKMHRNSQVHRGTRVPCPFCGHRFVSTTGVTHHVESGSCPNAKHLNRERVYELVSSGDPHGAISKKLIGWTDSGEYEATGRAWNGDAYECYFCGREFGQLSSLNQHLNSPVHQQNIYHCPNRACGIDFKTLAAVVNHLESESCGFIRFENVQKKMGGLMSGSKLLTF